MRLAARVDASSPVRSPDRGRIVSADISFIETQFPVSRLSKESYKERKANSSQTLTGLGKWWGRKPLVMVRAIILGLVMPASEDSRRDRDVFLALLTMTRRVSGGASATLFRSGRSIDASRRTNGSNGSCRTPIRTGPGSERIGSLRIGSDCSASCSTA